MTRAKPQYFVIVCPVTDKVLCADYMYRSYPLMFAEPKLYRRSHNAERFAPRYRSLEHSMALNGGTCDTLVQVECWDLFNEKRRLRNEASLNLKGEAK